MNRELIERLPVDAATQAIVEKFESVIDARVRQATALPRRGTPAANLTERDCLALAIAAGAPYRQWLEAGELKIETAVPVGITDRGDGGYILAIGSMLKDRQHG